MAKLLLILSVGLVAGCESVYLGTALPVPGPIKPHIGASVGRDGVRGHGGVSANAGPVPVHVGGSTTPIK